MARKKELKTIIRELFSIDNAKLTISKLKLFLFYSIFMGLIINYITFIVFHQVFKYYTFPAYGMLLYLIKSEFIYIFRWCFHKIPGVEE